MLTSDAEAAAAQPGDGPSAPPLPEPRGSRLRVARAVGAIGRLMMTTGVVVLLLVVYQLWGTNIENGRAQGELADEFASRRADTPTAEPPTTTETPTTTRTPATTEAAPSATAPIEVAPTVAPPAL
ncbi:MAG TPA: hypothetical protein VNL12_12070, partial [Iamia sp.]